MTALDHAPATPRRPSSGRRRAVPTIVQAMEDPKLFGPSFKGESWNAWRIVLKAAYALKMTDAEREFFGQVAERAPPPRRVKEAWFIVGRGGGKDSIASLIAAYSAALFEPHGLRGGEKALVSCLACDREQAQIVLNYTRSYFTDIPLLQGLVARETANGFGLKNGVDIAVTTNSFRHVRGRSGLCAILDECALYRDVLSQNPDEETYAALKPGLMRVPGSMLIGISTPYRKSGLLYRKFRESYGVDDDDVLVIRAPSIVMNPTLDQVVIEQEIAADPAKNKAEYLAEWRDDISGWAPRELIESAVDYGVVVRPPRSDIYYRAFIDVSGGVRDSAACAIAHREDETAVLDCLVEVPSPHDPNAATRQMADVIKSYGLTDATGDKYAAQWTVEAFAKYGITYQHSERDRSAIYLECLPLFTSGRVRLLDHKRLVGQFASLERRTSSLGRDRVDHGPNGHDDLCNAAAGALVMGEDPLAIWDRLGEDSTPIFVPAGW